MPQMTGLLLILHLRIRNGCTADRTPVHNPGSLVNIAFFVHTDKGFLHRPVAALIHGKAFSFPITGRTQFFQLFDNGAAILALPLPGSLQKLLSSQFLLGRSFFL